MVSLPAQSSYTAQSKRTAMGNRYGKGVARPITRKRVNSDVDASDKAYTEKKPRIIDPVLDISDSSSESDGDFDPTIKAHVPDRFQKARMRREVEAAQKLKEQGIQLDSDDERMVTAKEEHDRVLRDAAKERQQIEKKRMAKIAAEAQQHVEQSYTGKPRRPENKPKKKAVTPPSVYDSDVSSGPDGIATFNQKRRRELRKTPVRQPVNSDALSRRRMPSSLIANRSISSEEDLSGYYADGLDDSATTGTTRTTALTTKGNGYAGLISARKRKHVGGDKAIEKKVQH